MTVQSSPVHPNAYNDDDDNDGDTPKEIKKK